MSQLEHPDDIPTESTEPQNACPTWRAEPGPPTPSSGPAMPPDPLPGPETSKYAIASVILGALILGGVGSLLAVIYGHQARAETRNGQKNGQALALVGLVLGYSVLGLVLVIVLGVVAETQFGVSFG